MNIRSNKKLLIVELEGEIDEYSCIELRKKIDDAYEESKLKDMVFDFYNASFIDSSGIGMILGRYKKVSENNGTVYITGAKEQVDDVFKVSDIYKLITPYRNLEDLVNE